MEKSEAHIYNVGDSVDIESGEIWCPGTVIKVSDKSILVHYTGWDDTFDEVITKYSRIAPGGTYVTKYKGWVNLYSRMQSWPCVVYDRPPRNNHPTGIAFLKDEKKLYVEPSGPMAAHIKPYHHGVWITANNIVPFTKHYASKFDAGLTHPRRDIMDHFILSVSELEKNESALDFEFRFDGTYEVNTGKAREAERRRIEEERKQQIRARKEQEMLNRVVPTEDLQKFPPVRPSSGSHKVVSDFMENSYKRVSTKQRLRRFHDSLALDGLLDVTPRGSQEMSGYVVETQEAQQMELSNSDTIPSVADAVVNEEEEEEGSGVDLDVFTSYLQQLQTHWTGMSTFLGPLASANAVVERLMMVAPNVEKSTQQQHVEQTETDSAPSPTGVVSQVRSDNRKSVSPKRNDLRSVTFHAENCDMDQLLGESSSKKRRMV